MLSYQNRNRMFEEVLGCRIALEAAFDTLVNAYAFSFCNYRSPIEGVDVQRDIAMVLARAGYLQIANHRFAEDGCWPWGVAGLLPAGSGARSTGPLPDSSPMKISTHTIQPSPTACIAGTTRRKNGPASKPTWIDTETGPNGGTAIRTNTAPIEPSTARRPKAGPRRTAQLLRYQFHRPSLLDLNDPIPLTFELAGVEPDQVVSIECSGATSRASRISGRYGSVSRPSFCRRELAGEDRSGRIGRRANWSRQPSFRRFRSVEERWEDVDVASGEHGADSD